MNTGKKFNKSSIPKFFNFIENDSIDVNVIPQFNPLISPNKKNLTVLNLTKSTRSTQLYSPKNYLISTKLQKVEKKRLSNLETEEKKLYKSCLRIQDNLFLEKKNFKIISKIIKKNEKDKKKNDEILTLYNEKILNLNKILEIKSEINIKKNKIAKIPFDLKKENKYYNNLEDKLILNINHEKLNLQNFYENYSNNLISQIDNTLFNMPKILSNLKKENKILKLKDKIKTEKIYEKKLEHLKILSEKYYKKLLEIGKIIDEVEIIF